MPIYKSRRYPESQLAHRYLDGLVGLEIGGSLHNAFGLDTLNVDFTDSMDTEFKREEVALCGGAMPVQIVAHGCAIPVQSKSFDFVVSSHVIEHFFDPIAALEEWRRIARKYVFIICPQPDTVESDRRKGITPLAELISRHAGDIGDLDVDHRRHHSRWTSRTFVQMCVYCGFGVADVQDPDDKVGNGFAVVLDVAPSLVKRAVDWKNRQVMRVRMKAAAAIVPPQYPSVDENDSPGHAREMRRGEL
jgi:SAM-dependent methyltransferase